MDEKTEELRDIFLDVADEETVTESQEATRGTLVGDSEDVGERLRGVISSMREEFTFRTDLSDSALETVVREFYEGAADAEMAASLDVDEQTVFWARLDLHLLHEEELARTVDAPDAVRTRHADGTTPAEVAEAVGIDESTAERALALVDTQDRARRVSYRYRTAFEEILTDADMTVQFTADALEDGLEEATEGAETDVDF
ncbi:MAG: hypothetical protein V5A55_05510 [Halovenus sp.]